MQPDLATWLARKPAGPKPRKPLRRRTPERAKQEREYAKRRRIFLAKFPLCQVWLAEHGLPIDKQREIQAAHYKCGILGAVRLNGERVPLSTEVHHAGKRRGIMLLDERYWFAVCEESHKKIEGNLSWARENGYSLNF